MNRDCGVRVRVTVGLALGLGLWGLCVNDG